MRTYTLSILPLGFCLLLSAQAAAQSERDPDVRAALAAHNDLRELVSAPPLTWSPRLAGQARRYAQRLAQQGCQLRHASVPEGENLYAMWGSPEFMPALPFEAASLAWGAEKPHYHGQPIGRGRFEAYGHYTQMIWKDTREVGIASATGKQGCLVVVARYHPAGNVIGSRPGD